MTTQEDRNPRPEDFEAPTRQGTEAKIIRYVKPDLDRVKGVVVLARSDIMLAAVQLVKKGGENNLHSHSSMDGFWFVLNRLLKYLPGGPRPQPLGRFSLIPIH